jgi:hypothetical protein
LKNWTIAILFFFSIISFCFFAFAFIFLLRSLKYCLLSFLTALSRHLLLYSFFFSLFRILIRFPLFSFLSLPSLRQSLVSCPFSPHLLQEFFALNWVLLTANFYLQFFVRWPQHIHLQHYINFKFTPIIPEQLSLLHAQLGSSSRSPIFKL